MSRRVLVTVAVLTLRAGMLCAQDSVAMLRGMEARLDSARRLAARSDSVTAQSSATDTVRAGRLRIATSAALRPAVEAAAAEAWESLSARFGAAIPAADALPVMQFGGPESVLPRAMDRRELARGLEGPVAQAIWRRQDSRIVTWLNGGFPTGAATEDDLVSINDQLARIPARQNIPCLRRHASACAGTLGLRMGADTLAEWYAPNAWPRLAELLDASLTGREAWLRDRCAAAGDLEACRTVLTPSRVLRPVGPAGRQLLMALALDAGGAGAFERLSADTMATVEQRLADAAGVPIDTLLSRWADVVASETPGSAAPDPAEALLALAWCLAVLWMAIRGSRSGAQMVHRNVVDGDQGAPIGVSNRALGLLTVSAIAATTWLVVRGSVDDRSRSRPGSPERVAARALADSVSRLGLLVQTNELRLRVDSAVGESDPGRVPRVIVLGDGNAAMLAPMTDSLLGALHVAEVAAVPMRLALVESSPEWSGWRMHASTFAILPGEATANGCTAVRVVTSDAIEARGELWSWLRLPWEGAVGPCWYLASFGTPGPGIRAWLDSRYWDVAGAVPPHSRRANFQDNYEPAPNLFYRLFGDLGGMYAGGSATLQGCASDKPSLCEAALLGSPFPPGLLPQGIVGTERLNAYALGAYQWLTGVPPWASRELLATMVEVLGPVRFAEFWTSRAPVANAFQAAAGIPFAEWYSNQLRRDLRQAGVVDPGSKVFWPSAAAILALALGLSLWGARRRQVR